jgi:RecJ-like exonuclease
MDNPDDVTVFRMGPGCDLSDVGEGKVYIGRVQGFANFGTFVQLNDRVKGLVHKSNVKTTHKERETILVRVRTIRPNGNIDLEEVTYPVYTVEMVERKSSSVLLAELSGKVGKTGHDRGRSPGSQTRSHHLRHRGRVRDRNAARLVEAGAGAYQAELGHRQDGGEVMLAEQPGPDRVESCPSSRDRRGRSRRIETASKRGWGEDIPLL